MNSVTPDFFVVGSVRTGSTLLRILIGHHPKVARCEEMEYLLPGIEMQLDGKSLADYTNFLSYDRIFTHYKYQVETEAKNISELMETFFYRLKKRNDAEIVGGTVHNNFSLLPEVWPNAKYIFLDRDPRDVSNSVINMGWAGNGWYGAKFWLNAKENWKRVQRKVDATNCLALRYEDLINNPENCLKKICELLTINYTAEMLDIETNSSYKRPNKKEAASWATKGKQRNVAEVETKIGTKNIINAGYDLSNYPAVSTDPLSRLLMKLKDKWFRLKFKLRLYNWDLWFANYISRHLGIESWKKATVLKMNQIEEARLK